MSANLAELIRGAAQDHPARPALVFRGRPISYLELDERVDLTAAALAELGVRPGDRVALLAGNVPEFVSVFYGALRAGAVACPLNVMLTPEELGYILADAGAKVAVSEMAYLPALLSVRDRLANLETVVVIGGPPAPARTVSLEEALERGGDPPEARVDAADPAVIAYTAGTTAEPKGAVLTHGNLLANLDQVISVPALAEAAEDVVLLALPLFHIYALNVALGVCAASGATAVLVDGFEAAETLGLIRRHAVTVVFGAPPMFSAWLDVARGGAAPNLSSIRLAGSGAAPLPRAVLKEFRERFGITIWEGYGLTEAGPAVTTNAVGAEARAGSIGLPLPGLDVRLVDEHGEDAEEDDPGEIWVRGPNVFAGYWNRPQETAEVMQGHWLKTGDVAYRDDDGYLYLVDRLRDLIIVSGFNVFPKEVEEAIEADPRVDEAAVIGVPDERTGEAVEAWVVPTSGADLAPGDVAAFLDGHVARFKIPKAVHVVDEVPHHVTGKILRRALRHQAAAGFEGEHA